MGKVGRWLTKYISNRKSNEYTAARVPDTIFNGRAFLRIYRQLQMEIPTEIRRFFNGKTGRIIPAMFSRCSLLHLHYSIRIL